MLKRRKSSSVWQRFLFLALVAAICSLVINLNFSNHPIEKMKRVMRQVSALNETPKVSVFSVPQEFQGRVIAETRLPVKEKVIALTFDDGPWPRTTEQVLDILKENDIKATFFWIGRNVKHYPGIAKLVVDAGHVIGNHTWHHWYKQMDPVTAAREIEDTAAQIYETVGVRTELFRPPGGFLKNGPAGYAEKRNYAVMMWSADSRDWHFETPQVLIRNVLKEAQPGGIVLMHDGGGNRSKTVKALPQIISDLRKRGYKFVTVPELLALRDEALKSLPEAAPTTSLSKLNSPEVAPLTQERKLHLAPSDTRERAARKPQKAQSKHPKQLSEG